MPTDTPLPKRKDIRLKGFDYSSPANYFVTIVTQGRAELLSRIDDQQTILTPAGQAVEQRLLELPAIHTGCDVPFHIVMPNHLHFILFSPGGHYLAEIIRRLKSITTHDYIQGVNASHWPRFNDHLWQRNYYEHIIRNQRAYDYIANYILTNPLRWHLDRLNTHCLPNSDDISATLKSLYP